MPRHFLYLTNTRLVSLTASGSRLVARREFAVSGEGAEDFERHLRTLKGAPTHLITDLAEEDFRVDTIPHVGARDRDALLGRKLAQVFRNSPFRHAIVQGRETEGRRDDRVLYTAITNGEVLRPWLEAIERLRVPLAGIHSAAILSLSLLSELNLLFPHALLVTFSPGDAVRQTYFRGKEVRFSRLTPIDLVEGQSLGALLAEETTRTWQYLDSLRNFAHDDRLEVCLLVHPKDRGSIEPQLRDFAQIQYRLLDIEQVAAKLGLKPPPLGSTAEEVLVHLFLRRAVDNHYASAELRADASRRSARIALNAASLAILGAGVLWGGFTLARALQGDKEDQRLAAQMLALNREYDELARTLPSQGVGGAAMRDSVAFFNASVRTHPSPVDFLVPVSRVLEAHPRIRLLQVAWQTAQDPKATPQLPATILKDPPAVKAAPLRAQAAAPANPGDGGDGALGAPFQVALLEGAVQFTGNDFRGALEELERFAASLRGVPGYRAEVVESPLDTGPSGSVTGKHGEGEAASVEARFTLRITRSREGTP